MDLTDSRFLDDFLNHPNPTEMEQFRHSAATIRSIYGPKPCTGHSVFDQALVIRAMQPMISEYFKRRQASVPTEVVNALVHTATAYLEIEKTCTDDGYGTDAIFIAHKCCLEALVDNPEFTLWGPMLEILKILKRAKDFSFGMNMFSLKKGFGEKYLPVFESLITCDVLWSGDEDHDPVLSEVFGSIAKALRGMSAEKGLLLKTLELRVALLSRNGSSWKDSRHHSIWCNGSFTEAEMQLLADFGKNDERIRGLAKSIAHSGMNYCTHVC